MLRKRSGAQVCMPVVIRARAQKTDDGRTIHTITIAANDRVSKWHEKVNLRELDLDPYMQAPVVLWQHDPKAPIGKTLAINRNTDGEILVDFVFGKGDDPLTRQVEEWWNDGIVNAASINFEEFPADHQFLTEWSLVSVPADRDAVRRLAPLYSRALPSIFSVADAEQEESMTAEEIQAALEAALRNEAARSGGDAALDVPATATALAGALQPMFAAQTEQMQTLLAERDAARDETERQRAAADAAAAQEREQATARETEIRESSFARAQLIVRASDLLPEDFDAETATEREILQAAMRPTLGDSVDRHGDEYLRAYMDIELQRRAEVPERREAPAFHRSASGQDRPYVDTPNVDNGTHMSRVRSARLDEVRDEASHNLRNRWRRGTSSNLDDWNRNRQDADTERLNRRGSTQRETIVEDPRR